jgi:hypothetical protein
LPDVDQRPDQHVLAFFGVEDLVGLKAEAAIGKYKLTGTGSNERKLSQETEGALEACVIGFGCGQTARYNYIIA